MMIMKETDNMDGLPKLMPDNAVVFDEKSRLRRAAETDFACSEYEYQCIAAAEEGCENGDSLTGLYSRIRLTPDRNIVMPDKNRLKHRRPKLVFILSGMGAAAAVAGLMMLISKPDEAEILPVTSIDSQEVAKNIDKPVLPTDSIKDERMPAVQEIAVAKPEKPARSKVQKKQETVRSIQQTLKTDEIAAPEQTPETDENPAKEQDLRIERERVKLAAIQPVNIQVERNTKVAVATKYEYPKTLNYEVATIKLIDNVIYHVESLDIPNSIQTWRENMYSRFQFTDILGKLSSRHSINKYMKELKSKNSNIEMEIHTHAMFENNVKEIYDEDGKLVKAVFFTNVPIKTRNKN